MENETITVEIKKFPKYICSDCGTHHHTHWCTCPECKKTNITEYRPKKNYIYCTANYGSYDLLHPSEKQ